MKFRSLAIAGPARRVGVRGRTTARRRGSRGRQEQNFDVCRLPRPFPGFRAAYPEDLPRSKLGGQNPGLYRGRAQGLQRRASAAIRPLKAIASSLSEQDMADLAAYYADGRQEVSRPKEAKGRYEQAADCGHCRSRFSPVAGGAVAGGCGGGPRRNPRRARPATARTAIRRWTPEFPKLAGQPADYLEKALRDYKKGRAAKNPMMMPMAQGLSKQDIKDLAAYYSSLKGDLKVKY